MYLGAFVMKKENFFKNEANNYNFNRTGDRFGGM